MVSKRKRLQRKQFGMAFALKRTKTEQLKGRDKTMVRKKTVYRQEVNSE